MLIIVRLREKGTLDLSILVGTKTNPSRLRRGVTGSYPVARITSVLSILLYYHCITTYKRLMSKLQEEPPSPKSSASERVLVWDSWHATWPGLGLVPAVGDDIHGLMRLKLYPKP